MDQLQVLAELFHHVFTVGFGRHLFVNEFDDPVFVDVEGPPFGNFASLVNDAVSLGDPFFRIAENRVIELQ